jgi:glycerol-3-phosphate acyltransferase PlsY
LVTVAALYPNLTLWLVLFFDTTAVQMVFYGLLTVFVATTAYRKGERWAWISLLVALLLTLAHLFPTFTFFTNGILVNSGISIGVVGILVSLAFLVVGLLLPAKEVLSNKPVAAGDRPKGSRKLSFGWIYLFTSGRPHIQPRVKVGKSLNQ